MWCKPHISNPCAKFLEILPLFRAIPQVVYARKGASAASAAQAGSMLAAPSRLTSLPEDAAADSAASTDGPSEGGGSSVPLYRAASAPVSTDPNALKRNAPFSVPQMLRQVSRVASEVADPEETEVVEEEEEEEEEEESGEEAWNFKLHLRNRCLQLRKYMQDEEITQMIKDVHFQTCVL